MVGGMVGNKARCTCTIINQQPYPVKQIRFKTRAGPVNIVFENIVAAKISQCNSRSEEQYPPTAVPGEINQDKNSEEQIKRRPMHAISHKRHQHIKNRIG